MRQREDLINSLCTDLKPVKSTMSADWLALIWLSLSAVYVVLVTAYYGPIRSDAIHQLLTVPRFLFETALGLVAIAMVAVCAFRAAIPGRLKRRFAVLSFGLLAVWLLQYVIGLWYPALPPSTLGAREDCWLQTIRFAVGPMLAGFLLTRRLYPLNPWYTTFGFSLVAGLLPALYMQLACMYMEPHILEFHILPGLAVALAGSFLALLYRSGTGDRR